MVVAKSLTCMCLAEGHGRGGGWIVAEVVRVTKKHGGQVSDHSLSLPMDLNNKHTHTRGINVLGKWTHNRAGRGESKGEVDEGGVHIY